MAKKIIRENSNGKKMGRSSGPLVKDEVLNDFVTPKELRARKSNNPKRYS